MSAPASGLELADRVYRWLRRRLYGFTELFAAFDPRGLGHRLDRLPPQRPAV